MSSKITAELLKGYSENNAVWNSSTAAVSLNVVKASNDRRLDLTEIPSEGVCESGPKHPRYLKWGLKWMFSLQK